MKIKRMLSVLVAGAISASMLAGCGNSGTPSGSAGAAEDKLRIGLSMSNRDQFLSTLEQAALEASKEKGVELKSFDSNVDVVTQLSHVTACANDGYDAMIINLVNTDNAKEMIDAAGDMPVIFVNRTPGNPDQLLKDGKVVYVGSDENEAGGMQGEYVVKKLEEAGKTEANIAILMGTLGMQGATLRTNAAKKVLDDSSLNITYTFEDTADWDRAKAMDKFVQFMGTKKPYDAVIANNDEMALGAVEAMKTTGEGKVNAIVAGVDATDSALQSIKEGDLAFTAFQNAKGQGIGAVEAAIKLAKGEACDLYNWVPFEAVDKDNVDNYMK